MVREALAGGGWSLGAGCWLLAAPLPAQPPAGGRVEVAVAGHTLQVPQGFTITVYAERLPRAHGLAFRGDTLYVAQESRIVWLVPGSRDPEVVVSSLPCCGGHWTRTIVFGPSDGRLYVAAGSSCNICDETDPRRAAVTRYNADGSGEEIFAGGLRNSVGLAFNPTTGDLWATNNDRDRLGDDIPPDRVNILRQGRFYGWPQCYLPNTPNPEYPGANCGGVEVPGRPAAGPSGAGRWRCS